MPVLDPGLGEAPREQRPGPLEAPSGGRRAEVAFFPPRPPGYHVTEDRQVFLVELDYGLAPLPDLAQEVRRSSGRSEMPDPRGQGHIRVKLLYTIM